MMIRYQGFSLIEMVMFIIVMGVMGSGIVISYQQSVRNSAEPVIRQRAIAVLSAYMDEIMPKRWSEASTLGGGCVITGSGACSDAWTTSTAYSIGDRVVPTTPNDHVYEVTTAGTSGATEPTWPTDGSSVVDGTITWLDSGTQVQTIGAETGESRSDFDDIDDYNGLSEAPTDQTGTAMPGYSDFSVSVSVEQPSSDWEGVPYQDVRVISVTVTTPGGESLSAAGYRLNY